jgi:hypothetical protein
MSDDRGEPSPPASQLLIASSITTWVPARFVSRSSGVGSGKFAQCSEIDDIKRLVREKKKKSETAETHIHGTAMDIEALSIFDKPGTCAHSHIFTASWRSGPG